MSYSVFASLARRSLSSTAVHAHDNDSKERYASKEVFVPRTVRAQELCESRGGCPGLPSLLSLRFLWT